MNYSHKIFASIFSILMLSVNGASAQDSDAATTSEEVAKEQTWDVSNPRAETREVNLDITSGTWISVDVSPDGETVVFDVLGDIYTVPMNGGEATNIASGLAWDIQPRFSPDGTKIAFTSDREGGDNLWVMDADGSNAKQISSESFRLLNSPNWSPDGNYIIGRKHFTTTRSAGTGEVWMYHIDGGNGVAIVERPKPTHQKDLGEPVYSPDGEYIYYSLNSTSGGTFEYAQDSNSQIYEIRRVNLTTGETEDVVDGVGGSVRPTPSPDGKKIAFIRRIRTMSALFIKDIESGAEEMLYANMDQDFQETWAIQGTYPGMDWTPDGRSIVFWAGGKIKKIDVASKTVSDIPFHISETRTVTDAPRPNVSIAEDNFQTKMVRWPTVSPDGTKIIYEVLGKLYIQDTTGDSPRRLTRDTGKHFELYPAFSSDGRNIVFSSWDDEKLGAIRTVPVRGGRSKIITSNPGHYLEPQFSPNGETIVFRKRSGGYLLSDLWSEKTGIFTMPTIGGEENLVSESGFNAHFSKDNERIYFSTNRDDSLHFISTDLNGNEERDHANAEFAVEFKLSPDGKWLAWQENYQTFIAPFTPTTSSVTLSPNGGGVPVVRLSGDGGNYLGFSKNSTQVNWSLGPTIYSANLNTILAKNDEGESAYSPPSEGIALGFIAEADKPTGNLALVGARIITMNNTSDVIENGTILIEDNRVVAIGNSADISVSSSYRQVDMSGKTIMPGLIDAHAHGAQGMADIIPQQNWKNYGHLALGVTTMHDPSNRSAEIFAASEYQRAGIIVAPRIFGTGEIIYGAKSAGYWAPIDSYDDALAHVRRLKAQGAISVKNYNQPRRDQRQQVVEAAREENMLVVAEGGAQYYMDMNMVADGNSAIEHTLPNQAVYEDVVEFWSQTNVAHTLTFVVNYGGIAGEDYWYQHDDVWKHPILSQFVPAHILQPRAIRRQKAPEEDYVFERIAKIASDFNKAGISISTGAHGQREGLGTHWEMWMYAQGGATPHEALEAATINPARNLGMDRDIGSLEAGKLADLVVLTENPLEDIKNSDKISHVMINGRLFDAMTLDEVGTGNHKTRPFYWAGRAQSDAR